MPVFPSAEWIQEYCDRLAAHPDAVAVAQSLDGVYRFVIEPGGALREGQVHGVEIRPARGGAKVTPVGALNPADAQLSFSASYPLWKQLVLGKLDLGLALMLRRVKVGGNLASLTGRLSSAQPLLEALRAVDTVWLEDA